MESDAPNWLAIPVELWQDIIVNFITKPIDDKNWLPYYSCLNWEIKWQLSFLRCTSKLLREFCDDYLQRYPTDKSSRASWPITCSLAFNGYLDLLKYVVASGVELSDQALIPAAKTGQLSCLKYIYESTKRWPFNIASYVAMSGSLECTKYALDNGAPLDEVMMYEAAFRGHFDLLKYLAEKGGKMNEQVCIGAAGSNRLDIL